MKIYNFFFNFLTVSGFLYTGTNYTLHRKGVQRKIVKNIKTPIARSKYFTKCFDKVFSIFFQTLIRFCTFKVYFHKFLLYYCCVYKHL